MRKKVLLILGIIIFSLGLTLYLVFNNNSKEDNKVSNTNNVKKILKMPHNIQAYTLNGKNTNISYNDLIEGYEIDSITCKNGTIATYNQSDNTVIMTNVHVPEYCVMNFKPGTYTVTIDAGGGYFGNPTEIDDGYNDVVVLQKGVSVPIATGNTLNLTPNQKYMLSFDYWSDGGSVEFDVDLFPDSLPQTYPVATTNQQTMNWIFSSSSSDMNSCQIRYFNDRTVPNPQQIAIINKHLYKCDDCTLTYTKDVTKGDAYGSLNTPKRYGWDFLGWYLEDGTKVESTSINNIKGNHTITAKWSHHNYQVKLVGVNGTIEYAPIWYYTAGWENAFTKITPNSGYTTNGATVSCTGSAGASISGDYLYLSNITEDQTCTVTFKKLTYNVTLSVVNGSGSTTKTVEHGSSVSFTGISPYSGYSSNNPTVSCTGGSLSGTTLTVSNVTSSRTCTITFKQMTLLSKVLSDNPTRLTRSNFTSSYGDDNTGTLFTSTEKVGSAAAKTVYYYSGNALNNWVKFAGFYWRIIRTNADGSIRMVFAGTSHNTTEAYIGISPVSNIQSNDTMYVGYKYGTSGSLANNRLNTNDSTIKKFIESWYKTNLTNYTKYLSNDAVYCNDRSIGSGTYSVYGTTEFEYGASARLDANPTYTCPSTYDAFSVNNSLAKLTYPIGLMTADEVVFAGGVYHSTGSLKPWYNRNSKTGDPGTDPSYSVVGSHWYWSMSPAGDTGSNGNGYMIIYPQISGSVSGAAVRPVISLKGNLIVASGNGSVSSPYKIVEN